MTKPSPSRTYNPLHFEDLEPHRFEDMVRQLIYDFRDWVDIQAVGRSGADKGVDIRAIEQVGSPVISDPDEDEGEYQKNLLSGERREWIFQCKRYSQINPKKLVSIVNEDLAQQEQSPYAYVVVAACNFSSTSREEFRREMVERQIMEFYLWGKAELEDRLYQPKNDHLLFAYFGISIQAKKRSQLTQLRSDLTLKNRSWWQATTQKDENGVRRLTSELVNRLGAVNPIKNRSWRPPGTQECCLEHAEESLQLGSPVRSRRKERYGGYRGALLRAGCA